MVTQTSNQLSHDEALELLPWHINSTLEQSLSEKVADHVERCSTCREESAILSNAIIALNTDESVTANLGGRFNNVLSRVREYERSGHRTRQQTGPTIGQRLSDWLGLSQTRLQWAGTFALGLAVGVATILLMMQSTDVDPKFAPAYEVLGTPGSAPFRLLVEFDQSPSANLLAELAQAAGPTVRLQQQSDTQYRIELPDNMTVKMVADIQSRLLAYDPIVAVEIDTADGDATSK